jgi:hypothetical protein
VFKNKVLRKIFGPKKKKVIGGWRKLHDEKLHDLCTSPNITWVMKSRMMRWVKHVASMGEKRNACRVLVGEHEGKRPIQRPRYRWEEMDWINLAQDRDKGQALVNRVMNLWVP